MAQKITSANTSINSLKLPKIFNQINWDKLTEDYIKKNGITITADKSPIILDYGAGKYTAHIRKVCADHGWGYVAYDPYNGSDKDWDKKTPSLIVCSNVLNVIQDDDILNDIHEWIYNRKIPYLITVYEGDKSGNGKETKKDCYQRNDKIINYKRRDEIIYKNVLTLQAYKCYIK